MKVSKHIKLSAIQILIEKITVIISLVILIIGSLYYGINQYIYVQSLTVSVIGEKIPINIFDILTSIEGKGGIIGPLSLITIVLPTYILILLKINVNSTLFSKHRLGSIRNIWISKVSTLSIISFLYTMILVIVPYILGGLYLGNLKCNWSNKNSILQRLLKEKNTLIHNSLNNINEYEVILSIFIILFLGLILIGILVNLLNNIIKNRALVFILVYGVCLAEVIIGFNTPILVNKLLINLSCLIDKSTLLINIVTTLALIIISFIGGKLLERNSTL